MLFGIFLVRAMLDLISLLWRQPRPYPSAPVSNSNDVIAVALGLILYLLFVLVLHALLIGVPVF